MFAFLSFSPQNRQFRKIKETFVVVSILFEIDSPPPPSITRFYPTVCSTSRCHAQRTHDFHAGFACFSFVWTATPSQPAARLRNSRPWKLRPWRSNFRPRPKKRNLLEYYVGSEEAMEDGASWRFCNEVEFNDEEATTVPRPRGNANFTIFKPSPPGNFSFLFFSISLSLSTFLFSPFLITSLWN